MGHARVAWEGCEHVPNIHSVGNNAISYSLVDMSEASSVVIGGDMRSSSPYPAMHPPSSSVIYNNGHRKRRVCFYDNIFTKH
jgi:hypothetical protein